MYIPSLPILTNSSFYSPLPCFLFYQGSSLQCFLFSISFFHIRHTLHSISHIFFSNSTVHTTPSFYTRNSTILCVWTLLMSKLFQNFIQEGTRVPHTFLLNPRLRLNYLNSNLVPPLNMFILGLHQF